jgi:hypothetical protein
VTRQEIFVNGEKCSNANGICSWRIRNAGRIIKFQAKAYDAAGNVGTSAVLTVTTVKAATTSGE